MSEATQNPKAEVDAEMDAQLAALGEAPRSDEDRDEGDVALVQDLINLAEPLPAELDDELDELASARAWRTIEDRTSKPVQPSEGGGSRRGAATIVVLFAAAAAVALWVNASSGSGPSGADVEAMGVQARAALQAVGAGPGSATARAEELEARYRAFAVDSEASG